MAAFNTNNLVTLADGKAYLGITADDTDQLLTEFINATTNAIEIECGRHFNAANYWEWHDGSNVRGRTDVDLAIGDDATILVQNWPIINVARVASGRAVAFGVSYTGSGIRATAYVTSSAVVLVSTSAAGVATTNTLSTTTYPTVSTLVTAADALADWTATLTADVPAADLHRLAGADAKNTTFQFTYPDLDDRIADVDMDAGIITLASSRFAGGRRNVLVQYRGGYEAVVTHADTADLRQIACELVRNGYNSRNINTDLSSRSLGDSSYVVASAFPGAMLDDRMRARLARWRRGLVAA